MKEVAASCTIYLSILLSFVCPFSKYYVLLYMFVDTPCTCIRFPYSMSPPNGVRPCFSQKKTHVTSVVTRSVPFHLHEFSPCGVPCCMYVLYTPPTIQIKALQQK